MCLAPYIAAAAAQGPATRKDSNISSGLRLAQYSATPQVVGSNEDMTAEASKVRADNPPT